MKSSSRRNVGRRWRHALPASLVAVLALGLASSATASTVTHAHHHTAVASKSSGHANKPNCHGKLTHVTTDGIGIEEDAIIPFGTAKGLFAKYCLSVSRTTVSSFPAAIANVLGGSVDVTMAPSITDIDFLAKSAPLRVIAGSFGVPTKAQIKTHGYQRNQDLTGVYVAKGSKLKKPTQLEGKTVSVPALGAQIHVVTAWAIKKAGGDPNKVNWVQLDFLTAESELQRHKLTAAGLTTPFSVTGIAHGDRLFIGDDVKFFGAGAPSGTWTTSAAQWASNKKTLSAFADAVTAAQRYADSHFSQFAPYAAKLTQVPLATVKQTSYTLSMDATNNAKALARTLQRVAKNMKYAGITQQLPKLTGVVVR